MSEELKDKIESVEDVIEEKAEAVAEELEAAVEEEKAEAVAEAAVEEDLSGAPLKEIKAGNVIKMIIGIVAGLLFFIIPLHWNGPDKNPTMLLSAIKTRVEDATQIAWLYFALAIVVITLIMTIYIAVTPNKKHNPLFEDLFKPTIPNFIARIAAVVIAFCCLFNVGPEWILDQDTGNMMFTYLIPSILIFFYLGIIVMPTLTDFGMMEIVGSLVERVFRPLFRLPARSAILCISAFIGSGTIQLIPIEEQYKDGYLTGREASTIAVGFCTIVFGAVMAYSCGIAGVADEYFFHVFFTCLVVAVVATIIMSRIPPLTMIPNEYYQGNHYYEMYQDTFLSDTSAHRHWGR